MEGILFTHNKLFTGIVKSIYLSHVHFALQGLDFFVMLYVSGGKECFLIILQICFRLLKGLKLLLGIQTAHLKSVQIVSTKYRTPTDKSANDVIL